MNQINPSTKGAYNGTTGHQAALVPSAQALDDRLQQAQDLLLDANAKAVTFVRKHPVPCLIGAVAVGYLVGRAAARRWLW